MNRIFMNGKINKYNKKFIQNFTKDIAKIREYIRNDMSIEIF